MRETWGRLRVLPLPGDEDGRGSRRRVEYEGDYDEEFLLRDEIHAKLREQATLVAARPTEERWEGSTATSQPSLESQEI